MISGDIAERSLTSLAFLLLVGRGSRDAAKAAEINLFMGR
jgi:hypothetical protein